MKFSSEVCGVHYVREKIPGKFVFHVTQLRQKQLKQYAIIFYDPITVRHTNPQNSTEQFNTVIYFLNTDFHRPRWYLV